MLILFLAAACILMYLVIAEFVVITLSDGWSPELSLGSRILCVAVGIAWPALMLAVFFAMALFVYVVCPSRWIWRHLLVPVA